MPLNVQIICICSKNAIRKNVDFQKNTAECKITILKKSTGSQPVTLASALREAQKSIYFTVYPILFTALKK
jgi:hypothetical protein